MGNRTENKNRKKRRIIFTAGLIAAVFGAVMLAVFAGTGICRALKDYFRYSSMQGTGVILEEQGLNGLFEWIREQNDVPEVVNISYLELDLAEMILLYLFRNLTQKRNIYRMCVSGMTAQQENWGGRKRRLQLLRQCMIPTQSPGIWISR